MWVVAGGDSLDAVRRELALLCRRKRARFTKFSAQRPVRWVPMEIINPATSMPFSDEGAWGLIARLLEDGHPIEVIELEHPPGRTGYVMKYQLPDETTVYIKLERGSGVVYGRSFHLSAKE